MKHIEHFSNYRDRTSISNDLDDIFFEFSDYHDFFIKIYDDIYIHQVVKTDSVIYGNNFIYPSDYELGINLLPSSSVNKDWELGFIVKLSCQNPTYNHNTQSYGRYDRGKTTKKKRLQIEREQRRLTTLAEMKRDQKINLIKNKVKLILDRCPKGTFLYGVKNSSDTSALRFDFAFLYDQRIKLK